IYAPGELVELVEGQRIVAHDPGHLPFAEDVEDDVDVGTVEAARSVRARQIRAEHQRPRVHRMDAVEGLRDGEIEAAETAGLHPHARAGELRDAIDALLRHAQVVHRRGRQLRQHVGDVRAGGDVHVDVRGPAGQVMDLPGQRLQVPHRDLLALEQVEADAADAL